MLESADNFCKIIATDDAEKAIALKALVFVNIDKANASKLLTEPLFEVRKFRSEKKLMENCAVVKCSAGKLWNIPHKILERAVGAW